MHTGTKCRTRIDVENHLVLILRLYLFPWWNHEQIINIELMEKLLPVIDPVNILRLRNHDGSLTDIHKVAKVIQLTCDICHHLICVNRIFIALLNKKAQIRNTIILRSVRQDIHEHLLLLKRRQRYLVLDLCTLKTNVIECTDDDILCIRNRFYGKFLPLHIWFLFIPFFDRLYATKEHWRFLSLFNALYLSNSIQTILQKVTWVRI